MAVDLNETPEEKEARARDKEAQRVVGARAASREATIARREEIVMNLPAIYSDRFWYSYWKDHIRLVFGELSSQTRRVLEVCYCFRAERCEASDRDASTGNNSSRGIWRRNRRRVRRGRRSPRWPRSRQVRTKPCWTRLPPLLRNKEQMLPLRMIRPFNAKQRVPLVLRSGKELLLWRCGTLSPIPRQFDDYYFTTRIG